jgi:glycine cleavage system H lipoate-binding protein
MQAGIVKSKDCTNYYDCGSCKYDRGMRKAVESGKRMSWQDAMRRRPSMDRVCRHSLTNRIKRRICAYDYICASCDFDQYFEEIYSQKAVSFPLASQNVKGFMVPANYYFHMGHTWARIESGGCVRVGMDDFARKLLGKADALDLPLMGKELTAGQAGWGVRRQKNQAEVLSPVSGVILEVNQKVREKPEIANANPYGEGWLFSIKNPDLAKSVKDLMTGDDSLDWMNNEISQLEKMIEKVAGPLAADGGVLGEDIYGTLPDLGWKELTSTFLKS